MNVSSELEDAELATVTEPSKSLEIAVATEPNDTRERTRANTFVETIRIYTASSHFILACMIQGLPIAVENPRAKLAQQGI